MSARSRRKNRNRGLKKGHRRENGPTPRHRVRGLRDAPLPEEVAVGSPASPRLAGRSTEEVPWSVTAASWTDRLALVHPQQFPDLFRQAVTDEVGAVAVLHRMLETASEWCRRHGADHSASELEEITARLSDLGEDLLLAGENVEEEAVSRQNLAAAASRTSTTLTARPTARVGPGGIGVPAARPLPRSR